MSRYPDARFLKSADAPGQFAPDTGAEVAFAGRSNAGKSSAVNALVGRRRFARVSKTPGRTRLVNFFELAGGERLVDLPGYGFAQVAPSMQAHWRELMDAYFAGRRSLRALFLVVDARRGVGEHDRRMMSYAAAHGLPVHVLLTKADKLGRGQAARALAGAREALAGEAGVQLFSATARAGLEEAREALERLLRSAPPEDGRDAPGGKGAGAKDFGGTSRGRRQTGGRGARRRDSGRKERG